MLTPGLCRSWPAESAIEWRQPDQDTLEYTELKKTSDICSANEFFSGFLQWTWPRSWDCYRLQTPDCYNSLACALARRLGTRASYDILTDSSEANMFTAFFFASFFVPAGFPVKVTTEFFCFHLIVAMKVATLSLLAFGRICPIFEHKASKPSLGLIYCNMDSAMFRSMEEWIFSRHIG